MRKLKGPFGNSANEDGMDYLAPFCTSFHNLVWPWGLATYIYFLHLPYESDSHEWGPEISIQKFLLVLAIQFSGFLSMTQHEEVLLFFSGPSWVCWFSYTLSLPLNAYWFYFAFILFSLSREHQDWFYRTQSLISNLFVYLYMNVYVYICVYMLTYNCMYCCSVTQVCLTLCNFMDCSTPGFPVSHHLLKFAQVHVHCIGDYTHVCIHTQKYPHMLLYKSKYIVLTDLFGPSSWPSIFSATVPLFLYILNLLVLINIHHTLNTKVLFCISVKRRVTLGKNLGRTRFTAWSTFLFLLSQVFDNIIASQ